MQFSHTIDKVLSGEKTATRRIVKAGQHYQSDYATGNGYAPAIIGANSRLVWLRGYDYAVSPGRGQKSVARIRITGIRLDDAREIVDADVKAEGFNTTADFLMVWCQMHDPKFFFERDEFEPDKFIGVTPDGNPWLWTEGELMAQLWERPASKYACWALTFALVARANDETGGAS